LDTLALEDGTETLYRNVGNKPIYAVQQLEDLSYSTAEAWNLNVKIIVYSGTNTNTDARRDLTASHYSE
jgi:hypothetical protein